MVLEFIDLGKFMDEHSPKDYKIQKQRPYGLSKENLPYSHAKIESMYRL